MDIKPFGSEEINRLRVLNSYDILDSLPEQDYDDIAQLVADICQTPVALISLMDNNRHWFKSHQGLTLQEVPRHNSFFMCTVDKPTEILIVPDSRTDSHFAHNPLVTGYPHIVFYAGIALVDTQGFVLGSLAVIDTKPGHLSQHQVSALRILSKQVVRLLALRKQTKALHESEVRYHVEKVALETNQKRLQTIFENAPIGLGLLRGPDHVFELVNQQIAQMAGRQIEQMQGKPLLEALPELAQQGLKEIFDSVRQTSQRFVAPEIPVTIQRNDKLETAYFYASFEPVQEPDGTVSIVDFSLEITDQLQNQRNLQESENRLRNMIDQAPMAIGLLKGRDMIIETGNAKIFEVWGKDPSIIGMRLIDALPELKGQPFIHLLEDVYDTGSPFHGNATRAQLTRHGLLEDVYFDFTYTPLRNADNAITGVMVLAVDVTAQALARQEIEKSEARFRGLIEEAPFAIAVYETSELIISVANEAMIQIWGKTPAVVGQKLKDALPELEGQPFIPLLNTVYTTGQTYRTPEQQANLVVDGVLQSYWFSFVYQPLTDKNGAVYAILNMAVDTTERVIARQQIEESEREYRNLASSLEARVEERTEALHQANLDLRRSNDNLQQFAYVASHDLQEPLRKIQSFSNLLNDQFKGELNETATDYLNRITNASARMSTLIKDLLSYSRIATHRQPFSPVPLNAVIAGVLDDLLLEITQRKAQVTVDELPVINGDESQLQRLFQNLLSNAIKFTPADQSPQVHIRYFQRQPNELSPDVRPSRTAPFYHQIDVVDHGVGFDIKYLDRIFQVFQRLHGKNEFPGTGVGLAICQRVVDNHNGSITAISKPDQGATFSVYFPG